MNVETRFKNGEAEMGSDAYHILAMIFERAVREAFSNLSKRTEARLDPQSDCFQAETNGLKIHIGLVDFKC